MVSQRVRRPEHVEEAQAPVPGVDEECRAPGRRPSRGRCGCRGRAASSGGPPWCGRARAGGGPRSALAPRLSRPSCTTRGSDGAPSASIGMPRAARWSTAGFESGPHSEKTTASRAVAASWVMARWGSPAGCAMSSIPAGMPSRTWDRPSSTLTAKGSRKACSRRPSTTTPTTPERPCRRDDASGSGPAYPRRWAAARTRSTVWGATGPRPLNASEAVEVETPAACATARSVGRG